MSHRGKGSTGAFRPARGGMLMAVLRRVFRTPRRREIIVRSGGRVRYIFLPGSVQLCMLAVLAVCAGWIGYSSVAYVRFVDIVADKDKEIAQALLENRGLLGTLSRMRNEFSDVAGTLERNHRELEKLVSQNSGLRQDLGALRDRLMRVRADRQTSEKRRAALREQIDLLEKRLASAEERSQSLAGSLKATQMQLSSVEQDREGVVADRRSLRARIAGLESRLSSLHDAQSDLLDRVTGKAAEDIERLEQLVANTGLDPDKLIGRMGKADNDAGKEDQSSGLGGPFIPAADAAEAKDSDGNDNSAILAGLRTYDRHVARWDELKKLIRSLPLVPPLDQYRVSSGFGKRSDPMNGRVAMHEGVDLGSRRRAPVHATASGRVVFAGWNGKFGRMVEIDHGYGIHTRYAHLRRINVRRGQRVKFGHVIGQVGSSGRSTGNHLHYEVQVDGKPVDPERFMRAGKDVFKG